jgi:hypothetical protein
LDHGKVPAVPKRTYAQTYALVFGWGLLAVGVLGLVGVLDLSTWHNLLHVISGLAGLMTVRSYPGARIYALAFGAIYVLAAALGLGGGEGAVLHTLIGAAGIAAGLATPGTPAPTTA